MLTDQPTGAIIRWSALLAMVMCAGCQSAPRDRGALLWDRVKQVAGRLDTRHSAGRMSIPKNVAAQPSPKLTEQNFSEVQLALGRSLEQDGNLRGAEDAYRAAVRNDSGNAVAHHRLALIAERQGNIGEARELLHRAAKLAPHNAEVQCDLGYWYALRERWTEAERHYRRAVEINPRFDRAHNNWGLMLVRSGKPQAAMEHFAAVGLTEAEARNNLGLGYMVREEWRHADQQLQLALRSDPGLSQAAALASQVHMQASQNQVETKERTTRQVERPQLAAATRSAETRHRPAPARTGAISRRQIFSLASADTHRQIPPVTPIPSEDRPRETWHVAETNPATSLDLGSLMIDCGIESNEPVRRRNETIGLVSASAVDQSALQNHASLPARGNTTRPGQQPATRFLR